MVAAVAVAVVASAAAGADLATVIGATHWNPCYYLPSPPSLLPSLLNGASALSSAIGTKAIKVIMDGNPNAEYPWNSDWPAQLVGVDSLATLAASPYFAAVFAGRPGPGGWDYTVFSVISYRWTSPSWNYWCDTFSSKDADAEVAEFAGLSQYLMTTYAGTGKWFALDHCA